MTRVQVKSGLEVFLAGGGRELDGHRVGLVTNHTGVDHHFRSAVDHLHESGRVALTALFGPEHGVRGAAEAGDHIADAIDARTGLPVHSLYGQSRRPTPAMLAGLDIIALDIQDLGIRYATYFSTLIEVQAAAHEAGIAVAVFDRPVPVADLAIEGNIAEPAYRSFVGSYELPIRHGMTLGELGRLVAHEQGWRAPIVVPLDGWTREMWYDDIDLPWIPPSPNMPSLDALTLYAGTCMIEGTSLSEGRGTTRPFEYLGAPGIDAEALAANLAARAITGVAFRPAHFTPAFSKHAGKVCSGVHVYVTDRTRLRQVELGLHLLDATRQLTPEFHWVRPDDDARPFFIDLLLGSAAPRLAFEAGASPAEVLALWDGQPEAFRERRRPFLLCPEASA